MHGDNDLQIHKTSENCTFPNVQCGLQWQEEMVFISSLAHRQWLQCTEDILSTESFQNFNSTEKKISSFPVEIQVC